MNKIMLVAMMLAFTCLSGCASNGNNATVRNDTTVGSTAANQASAQNIAPITSYISNAY